MFTKKKLNEIDFIKTLAIILILFHHLTGYGTFTYLRYFYPYLGRFGLGLFVFISGYSLYHNNNNLQNTHDALIFFKKRLLKIYPLYILAFVIYYIFTQVLKLFYIEGFNTITIIGYITGLQMLISPRYLSISYFGFWYIGMIVIFYLLYPIIIINSKENIRSIILISTLLYIGLYLLRVYFNIIEIRVFLYYPIFITGIIVKYIQENLEHTFKKVIFPMPFILFISIIIHSKIVVYDLYESNILESNPYYVTLSLELLILSFTLLTYEGFHNIENVMGNNFNKFCNYVAESSYAVYLFHQSILGAIGVFSEKVLYLSGIGHELILILSLIPILIIGHIIQKFELHIEKRWKKMIYSNT